MTGSLPETRVARWTVPAVLLLGLALSIVGGVLADRHVREKADDRLNALADLTAGNLAEHVAHFAGLTRALQASFLDLPGMPAGQFRGFVDILRLHAGTHPIQAYFFAERRGGELLIRHAEPAAGNDGLPGLRLTDNPSVAAVLGRLEAEGALAATLPFAHDRTNAGTPVLAFLAPVYLADTQPPRFALTGSRLTGVVAITVNLDKMLAPLLSQLRDQQVRLRVAALPPGGAPEAAAPILSGSETALAGGVRYVAQRHVGVQGTQWRLTLEAGPELILFPQRHLAIYVPAVLLTLTLLLAALAHTLVRSRRLAERHAKEVTRDLRQSEARFRDLAELSSDWYWEQDEHFRFTEMSVGVSSKSGVDAPSTIGKLRWELPIEGVGEAEWARHRALLERHEPFHDFTYRMRSPDGSLRWFVVSGRPIFGPDGRFAGYRGTGKDITERKASEMALRESEERYRLLFELSPDAIMVLQDRVVVLANKAALALHRAASPQDLIGRPLRDLVTPEDWPQKESRLELMESGTEAMLPLTERRYLTLDGDIVNVETAAVRIALHGRPAVMSVARDIAERKRAEIQLRLAATVFENSREGVTVTDAGQNIISVNRAFTEITGYTEAEVLGRNPSLLQSGRQDRAFYAAMWQAIVRDGYWSGEIWNRRKNGEIYPELLSITVVRDETGKPLRYIGVFTDITERHRAEEAVQRERQLLEAVMDSLPVGVWLMDSQGRISRSNPAATRIWAGARYVGIEQFGEYKAWWADSGREIRPEEWAAARAFSKGETSINEKIVIQCFDGSRRTILNSAVPLFDAEGRISGAVIVNQDIDSLERAQLEIRQLNEGLERRVRERTAALEASNRELEAFSYSVSHDLRAPLRGIDGFAHILAEDYGSRLDDAARGHLERIRKASQRLSQTIDDMIELARITRMPLHRREVDLSSMARTVLLELSQHSRHRPEIVIAEVVTAQADPTLLRIVLENLLDNAWKFTSRTEPARIEFGVREIDGERAYFVRDNGVGFDPAYVDKLFQPFQRLHRPDEFAGTGIGLATVQRIVQRHGGRVRAEGSPGAGAAIYFTLP
jgi:nitrogen fixation negative regulator NifL